MGSRKRYVLECWWNSYNGKRVLAHRSVETYCVKELSAVRSIGFTDGTTMDVHVRPAEPRERVEERKGYAKLLSEGDLR